MGPVPKDSVQLVAAVLGLHPQEDTAVGLFVPFSARHKVWSQPQVKESTKDWAGPLLSSIQCPCVGHLILPWPLLWAMVLVLEGPCCEQGACCCQRGEGLFFFFSKNWESGFPPFGCLEGAKMVPSSFHDFCTSRGELQLEGGKGGAGQHSLQNVQLQLAAVRTAPR